MTESAAVDPVLQYVRIENFRSIRILEIDGLNDYNPIVGLNSAGKSMCCAR